MSRAETRRLAFVDSLRFLAAGLVVFQHLAERFPGTPFSGLVSLGPGVAGVVLFFLISGFVIPFSVERGFHFPSFMIRRFFRIYPLFLVAVAIVAFAGLTGMLEQWRYLASATAFQWIANLLLVQDFVGMKAVLGVSWTLIIELIWYGIFAAMFMWRGDQAGPLLATLAGVGIAGLALLSLALDTRIPLGRPCMIYAASLGYLTYLHHCGRLGFKKFLAAILTFLAVTWFASYIAFGHFNHPDITLAQALGPWTLSTLVFFGVILIPQLRHWGALNSGLLPVVGAASYSIYLLHPIANAIAEQYVASQFQVAAGVGLTAVFALLGYRFAEKPGIALGRAATNRLFGGDQRPAMVTQ